jgi:hypothetical protein
MAHWATRHIRKPNTWTWTYLWVHTATSGTNRAFLSTLIHCVWTIWDSLQCEIQHLQPTLKDNGYSSRDSMFYMPGTSPGQPLKSLQELPCFCTKTSLLISRLLAEHYIKTIHIPMKKTSSTLRPIKDDLCLKTSGVYCILCECGRVYVGQTSWTI